MTSKSILNKDNFDYSFSKNRRLKSFIFLILCTSIGLYPHFFSKKPPVFLVFLISLVVLIYGVWVLSKNIKISHKPQDGQELSKNIPNLDILVAARDEQNVIARLVERLFNLDYPSEKLKIHIIDDGSVDDTPIILKKFIVFSSTLNCLDLQ